MAKARDPSQSRLHQLLEYDPESGFFYWLMRREESTRSDVVFNWKCAGERAGAPRNCRNKRNGVECVIRIDGRQLGVGRMVWIFNHGPIPDGMLVDHINGDICDNRLENLRLATPMQNAHNSKTRAKSKSGQTGVYRTPSVKESWLAGICVGGKAIRLGKFKTKDAAIAARRAAEIKYFGEFAPCLSRIAP